MAFPLVTPEALNQWLCEHLKTVVEVRRANDNPLKPSKRRLSTELEDYVILQDPAALQQALMPELSVTQTELF